MAKEVAVIGKAKSLEELNLIMSEQIDAILAGERSGSQADSITNTIGKMFTGVKLQLEYARLLGRTPVIGMLESNEAA